EMAASRHGWQAVALQKAQAGQIAGRKATRTVGGDTAVNKQEQEARPGVIEHGTHGPPLCKAHQEPCIKKRVNKSGPNKRRYFYMCSRPPAADDEVSEIDR
ncbi:MAG: DNA-(apurinic or apyrimidinic site) lyase 2, partial [Trebouxia sp. A1-2]